jgi:hypothetical protein
MLGRVSTDQGGADPVLATGRSAARADRDPPRWVAALTLVGALGAAVAPLADWLEVAPDAAVRTGDAVREAARAAGEPGDERLRAWSDLGTRLSERHALSGLELVRWSSAARAQLAEATRAAGEESPGVARRGRAWLLVAVAIVGTAAAGVLLAAYLARHRLRRFRLPLRVLAGTAGVAALALAAGLDWFCRPTGGVLAPGVAQGALVVGGAGLLGGVVASLTWRSALPVLAWTVATIAAIASIARVWVEVGVPA